MPSLRSYHRSPVQKPQQVQKRMETPPWQVQPPRVTVQCFHGEVQDEQIVVPLPRHGRVQDLLLETKERAKRWPQEPALYLFDEADGRWARLDDRDYIEQVVASGDRLLVKAESR